MNSIRIVLFALGVGFVVQPALGQDGSPSIETIRKEAEAEVARRTRAIEARVRSALVLFRQKGILVTEDRLAEERSALAELGPGAIPPLVAAFRKESSTGVLDQIGRTLLEACEKGCVSPEKLSEELFPILLDKNDKRVATAIVLLGHLNSESARAPLMALLSDSSRTEVYAAALTALARLGDTSVHEALIAGLTSTSAQIRIAALEGLALLGRPQDAKEVVKLLQDSNAKVVISALHALAPMASNIAAMKGLHGMLKSENDEFVRIAAQVLGQIRNKSLSAAPLRRVVADGKRPWELRVDVAKILFKNFDDRTGLNELSKVFRNQIARNARNAQAQAAFGDFLASFPSWADAARRYEAAINLSKNKAVRSNLRIRLARCYAALGKNSKAATQLERSNLGKDWSSLADDPAFETLRKSRKYGPRFGTKND